MSRFPLNSNETLCMHGGSIGEHRRVIKAQLIDIFYTAVVFNVCNRLVIKSMIYVWWCRYADEVWWHWRSIQLFFGLMVILTNSGKEAWGASQEKINVHRFRLIILTTLNILMPCLRLTFIDLMPCEGGHMSPQN